MFAKAGVDNTSTLIPRASENLQSIFTNVLAHLVLLKSTGRQSGQALISAF